MSGLDQFRETYFIEMAMPMFVSQATQHPFLVASCDETSLRVYSNNIFPHITMKTTRVNISETVLKILKDQNSLL